MANDDMSELYHKFESIFFDINRYLFLDILKRTMDKRKRPLTSSTTDRVQNSNDNNPNQVIDLTASFEHPTVNWPTGFIDLNEESDSPPRRRRRVTGQDNRNNTESLNNSNIVVINDSPAASLARPKKAVTKTIKPPRTDKNDNSQQKKAAEANLGERRNMFFGDCPICFEPLGKNPLASTKCGHVFCFKCVEQAVKFSKKCPNCRTGLNAKTGYHPLYFSKN